MNKKQLIVAWGIGIIFWGTIITLYLIPIFNKKQKVNPDIFPVFRKIESYCLDCIEQSNVNPQEYERCKKVVELQKQARKSEFYPAEEYYKTLERLGFKLPVLYKADE